MMTCTPEGCGIGVGCFGTHSLLEGRNADHHIGSAKCGAERKNLRVDFRITAESQRTTSERRTDEPMDTTTMVKFLQCNINHSWQAHDLLLHQIVELKINVCAIAEPVTIPISPLWLSSSDKSAAIHWRQDGLPFPCVLIRQGQGFVAAKCGDVYIVSCCISPKAQLNTFLTLLANIDDVLNSTGGKCIICGDFNAKSIQWGASKTTKKGEALETWAAEHNLRLANVSNASTCIRPQGESTIDLTWVTPDINRLVDNWQIIDSETLSDHVYITFTFDAQNQPPLNRKKVTYPRWRIDEMDEELFQHSINWACDANPDIGSESVQAQVAWLQ